MFIEMDVKCKKCGDVLNDPLKSGKFIECKCGAVAIDFTDFYNRVIGDETDFEVIKK